MLICCQLFLIKNVLLSFIFILLFFFLFQSDFTSLEDYITYIYVTPNNRKDNNAGGSCSTNSIGNCSNSEHIVSGQGMKLELKFGDSILRTAGSYVLIYFSRNSSSVLGISDPFPAVYSSGQVRSVPLDW